MDHINNQLVTETRKALGLTMEQTATYLDIDTAYLWKVRRGERPLSRYALQRIADAIGKSIAELTPLIEAQTETDEKKRAYWQQVLSRRAATFAAIAILSSFGLTSNDAEASQNNTYKVTQPAKMPIQAGFLAFLIPLYRLCEFTGRMIKASFTRIIGLARSNRPIAAYN